MRRRHGPEMLGIGLVLGLCLALFWVARSWSEGAWAYAVDDAYIHLASARTLYENGTWGISPREFTSVSSSPLWVVIVAGTFMVTGAHAWVSLALNVVFAGLLVVVWCRYVRADLKGVGPRTRLAIAVGVIGMVLVAALPRLVLQGMEHVLQSVFTLLVAGSLADTISADERLRREKALPLAGMAALAVAMRYEALFVIATGCLLLAARRRFRDAIGVGVAAMAPAVLLGFWFVHQGGTFLPTPVMLKSRLGRSASLLDAIDRLGANVIARWDNVLVIAAVVLAIWFWVRGRNRRGLSDRFRVEIGLFAAATLLQLGFAKIGNVRYSGHLVVWLTAIAFRQLVAMLESQKTGVAVRGLPKWSAWIMAASALAMFSVRGIGATKRTARAMTNIYDQQRQMAEFIDRYYPHSGVALNDIGTTAWFVPGARILDLYGLASPVVAAEKLRGKKLTAGFLHGVAVAERAEIAIVYNAWHARTGVLKRWHSVGAWTAYDPSSIPHATVAFYAIHAGGAARLREQLETFRTSLPSTVVVKIAPL